MISWVSGCGKVWIATNSIFLFGGTNLVSDFLSTVYILTGFGFILGYGSKLLDPQ